jgi:hypothetical protein
MDDPSGRRMLASPKPEFGRRLFLAKTIFDGTKLPLVVESSQNHHIWYELRFSPELDESRIAPALT